MMADPEERTPAWRAGYAEGRKPHTPDAYGLTEIKVPWKGYTKQTRAEFCEGWNAGRRDAENEQRMSVSQLPHGG